MNTVKINELVKHENLTMKAMAVLNNLAMHSNCDDTCFPALKTIARETRMSVRTVQRGLDELLSLGIITKKHNYRANGSQTSNIYRIVACIAERAAAATENAMQKINDLRKKMEQSKKKGRQIGTGLGFFDEENNDEDAVAINSGKKTFIKEILGKLHFNNLINYISMEESHSSQPIT